MDLLSLTFVVQGGKLVELHVRLLGYLLARAYLCVKFIKAQNYKKILIAH